MPYRRPPQSTKKYIFPFNNFRAGSRSMPNVSYQKEYISAPLPNEKEYNSDFLWDMNKSFRLPDIFGFLKEKIKIEELILIGLIIMLLDSSIIDELLIIFLVYILLF